MRPPFQSAISNRQSSIFWRRGWDLNPRRPLSLSGFRDRCTKPLCDLSERRDTATWIGKWREGEMGRWGRRGDWVMGRKLIRRRLTPSVSASPFPSFSASPRPRVALSPRSPRLRISASRHRRLRKKACTNSRHSSSSTPVVNSIR
jgi:hypothetical protein